MLKDSFNYRYIALWLLVIKFTVVCVSHFKSYWKTIPPFRGQSPSGHPQLIISIPISSTRWHCSILRTHNCSKVSEDHKNEANHNASLLNCCRTAFILSIKPRLLKFVSKLTVILSCTWDSTFNRTWFTNIKIVWARDLYADKLMFSKTALRFCLKSFGRALKIFWFLKYTF